jgi:hypothetical protein
MTTQRPTCAFCKQSAVDLCPRCQRWRCAEHRPTVSDGWPAEGYQHGDLCGSCTHAVGRCGRQAGRVVVAGSAAVLGMVLASLMVLMVGGALGLSADIIILCMLGAELAGGVGSAYLADRRMQRWLLQRDQHGLANIPEARLLERGRPFK